MIAMAINVNLPQWLDEYIFGDLKANYCCSNSDMTVIDWNRSNVLNYLGTYFPRSYAESYCIYRDFFNCHLLDWREKKELSIFDFGCGIGGEIIGLLCVVNLILPNIKRVNISAFDGNLHALRLFERVIGFYSLRTGIEINCRIIPIEIEDFYDLEVLDSVVSGDFDIIMSFKAICEFVTKERFEQQNAYSHIVRYLLPKLNFKGIILFVDVTSYNNVSQEWLPKMMDKGLEEAGCQVLQKNCGYNQAFTISHSRKTRDVSKVAWRIIQKSI